MNVPGDDFMVKNNVQTFEEAIELSAESLEEIASKRGKKKIEHIFNKILKMF
jgi:hypothetical protein